jgi:hypothetical protein
MKNSLIIIIIAVLGFAFYWYSYKPQEITKRCAVAALDAKNYDEGFNTCMLSNGINKKN